MLGVSPSFTSTNLRKGLEPITSTTFTDSDSDYISLSNHADFQVKSAAGVASDFSVCGWIKIGEDATGSSNKDGYILLKAGAFRGNGFYIDYKDDSNDDEHFRVVTNTGGSDNMESTANIAHDTWYHFAFTYDVSATTGKIYIDGSLDKTDTGLSAPGQYTGDIHVGSSNTGSKFVSSVTSDIAFWKGAVLTDRDVLSLAQRECSPLQLESDSLKAWWPLDEESETGTDNVLDMSGNGHHGTSSGLADSDFDTTDSPTGI